MHWYQVPKEDGDTIAINLDRVTYLKDVRGKTRVFFGEDDHVTVDAAMSDIIASCGSPD